jgi:hypothetical protein
VYCHGVTLPASNPARTNPIWNSLFLTGAAPVLGDGVAGGSNPGSGDCSTCHGYPPQNGHNTTGCNGCHAHLNADNWTFNDLTKHINGTVEGGDCVGCHSSTQPITHGPLAGGSRRAVALEFANTWSHKRSAGGTVTKYDCCVCHMEGDVATGNPNATYHQDGFLQLRDPDTGATIKGVTFSGTPGSYTSTGTDAAPARFSRDLSNNSIEADVAAIQINLCLKCHDADGAVSTQAQVPGGSAAKPFATTIAGAGYSGAGVTAGGLAGGVTDINAAFATTNASYHPVRGKQNNSYVSNSRMNAPWNALSPNKTAGTTTSWGYLVSCWDCHAPTGATGVQTSTVTAHGGTVTLRGNVWANPNSLCAICHIANVGGVTNGQHGTGSAFASGTDGGMQSFINNQCHYCHSSDTTKPARPTPAADVHGWNKLTTSANWPSGNQPYAFMRNTVNWGTTSHKVLSGPGVAAGTANCSGTKLSSGCTGENMGSYTPGGVY